MLRYQKHRSYVNLPMLLRVVGWLLMIESLFMVIPLIVAIINPDESFLPFLICIGITGASGGLMTLM